MKTEADLFDSVTRGIVAAIDAGVDEWQAPWHGPRELKRLPRNAITGRAYNGINVLHLWAVAATEGYKRQLWATERQWHLKGAQVPSGAPSAECIFVSPSGTWAKTYTIYNIDVVGNVCPGGLAPLRDLTECIDEVDNFVNNTLASIRYVGHQPAYYVEEDIIRIPRREYFLGSDSISATEAFESTRLHELIHWTGATERRNRDLSGAYRSRKYAFEELVAELGAAFLCANFEIGNPSRRDHAEYIGFWLDIMNGDSKAIFRAARLARHAVKFLNKLQH